MGSVTGIAWTDATWNPIRGCSRVSEGCRNCYAERIAARFCRHIDAIPCARVGKTSEPFYGFAERTAAGPRWTGKVALVPEKLSEPLHWRKPGRVFVNSMSDLFHERLSDRDIAAVFGVMAACPHLTFQVLTKRPERARAWFAAAPWGGAAPYGPGDECVISAGVRMGRDEFRAHRAPWPLPNVWLGVSAEDQATLKRRAWVLLKTPAAVRFVSLEPLLGPVNLDEPELVCRSWRRGATIGTYLDWVIVGGESGPGARPFEIAWARSVVEQCRVPGVPVFVKQLGALPVTAPATICPSCGPHVGFDEDGLCTTCGHEVETHAENVLRLRDRSGSDPAEWPEDLRVREFPRVTG